MTGGTLFPQIDPAELHRFGVMARKRDHGTTMKVFDVWVREQFAAGWPTATARRRAN